MWQLWEGQSSASHHLPVTFTLWKEGCRLRHGDPRAESNPQLGPPQQLHHLLACVHVPQCGDENLQESSLFFHYVGSRD